MKSWCLWLILCLALGVRLLLIPYLWPQPDFHLQQDNYADHASAILTGNLNNPAVFPRLDTRLFPGYPLLIAALTPLFGSTQTAGLAINLFTSLAAIYLFYCLTHSYSLTLLFSFLPPVWPKQAIKIATEPLTACLFLLAIWLLFKKHSLLAGLVLGYSLSVRLIALPLFLALAIIFPRRSFICGFLLLVPLTFVFNYLAFGEFSLARQIQINADYGRSAFGVTMIFQDFIRTLDWHQYRIFASGLFYFLFIIVGQLGLWFNRRRSQLLAVFNYWSLFSLVFIFSISPTPLIQDLGRYSVVFAPASILGIYESFRRHPRQK